MRVIFSVFVGFGLLTASLAHAAKNYQLEVVFNDGYANFAGAPASFVRTGGWNPLCSETATTQAATGGQHMSNVLEVTIRNPDALGCSYRLTGSLTGTWTWTGRWLFAPASGLSKEADRTVPLTLEFGAESASEVTRRLSREEGPPTVRVPTPSIGRTLHVSLHENEGDGPVLSPLERALTCEVSGALSPFSIQITLDTNHPYSNAVGQVTWADGRKGYSMGGRKPSEVLIQSAGASADHGVLSQIRMGGGTGAFGTYQLVFSSRQELVASYFVDELDGGRVVPADCTLVERW